MLTLKNAEEKYILSTVRLVTNTGTGTGFICQLTDKKYSKLNSLFFLVTNKHVIKDATKLVIKMHKLDSAKANKTTKQVEVILNNQEEIILEEDINSLFYFHPNEKIDIAILNMNQTVLKKFTPLLMAIEIDNIIPDRNSSQVNIYDNITFIGYPNGLFDEKNLLPIIRKGSFATPYQIYFNGEPTFLIDASVFPGSSGSPVFLFDRLDIIETKSIKAYGKHMLDIGIVYRATEIRKLIKSYFIDKILQIPVSDELINEESKMT